MHLGSGSHGLATSLISVAVLAWLLYRQRMPRPLTTRLTLPLVLVVVGVLIMRIGANGHRITAGQVLALLVVLAGDAVLLGILRAYTVRLWATPEGFSRQGSWLTIGLWIVGFGAHFAVDIAAHLGGATTLLYLGVTWIAQRLVLQHRAKAVRPTS